MEGTWTVSGMLTLTKSPGGGYRGGLLNWESSCYGFRRNSLVNVSDLSQDTSIPLSLWVSALPTALWAPRRQVPFLFPLSFKHLALDLLHSKNWKCFLKYWKGAVWCSDLFSIQACPVEGLFLSYSFHGYWKCLINLVH